MTADKIGSELNPLASLEEGSSILPSPLIETNILLNWDAGGGGSRYASPQEYEGANEGLPLDGNDIIAGIVADDDFVDIDTLFDGLSIEQDDPPLEPEAAATSESTVDVLGGHGEIEGFSVSLDYLSDPDVNGILFSTT